MKLSQASRLPGGLRLARYSFLGFGDSVDIWFDQDGFQSGDGNISNPKNQADYLELLRRALNDVPRLTPTVEGLPFCGGLVGVSGYDVVRLFENLPNADSPCESSL